MASELSYVEFIADQMKEAGPISDGLDKFFLRCIMHHSS